MLVAFRAAVFAFVALTSAVALGARLGRVSSQRHRDLRMSTVSLGSVGLEVQSLEKSVPFYLDTLGMRVVHESSGTDSRTVALALEGSTMQLELTQKTQWNAHRGDAFVGLGLELPDAEARCDAAVRAGSGLVMPFDDYALGASIVPDEDDLKLTPVRYGVVADPDGHSVEVRQCGDGGLPWQATKPSLQKVSLQVLDLDDACDYYTRVLGMKLLRRRSHVNSRPKRAQMEALLGYGEEAGPVVSLVYNYATELLDHGSDYRGIKLVGNGNDEDLSALAQAVTEAAGDKSTALVANDCCDGARKFTDIDGHAFSLCPTLR